MKLIQTKAKKHGTFVSATRGILYVDPNHTDEQHHSPKLTEQEAAVAFERGLIEDPKDAKAAEEEQAGAPDPNDISHVAADRTEETSKVLGDDVDGAGNLDSRASTAWPDNERVAGGAEGFTDGVRQSDEHDEDAPPAQKRKPAAKG